MWKSALALLSGVVKAWNDWRQEKHDDGLVNTGRQLQTTDGLKAAVQGDTDAQKTSEAISDLSDDALDAELRNGPSPSADRK